MLNGAACASPDHDESIGKSANAERVNALTQNSKITGSLSKIETIQAIAIVGNTE
jgi:hypothetical protein